MDDGTCFGRVGPAGRIEGVTQTRLRVEIVGPEDEVHLVALLEPDPVLTRQHAADGDARVEDRVAGVVDPVPHAGLTRVEDDQRVKVVAGIKGNAEGRLSCNSCHLTFDPIDRTTPRTTCAACHSTASGKPDCTSCHVQHIFSHRLTPMNTD